MGRSKINKSRKATPKVKKTDSANSSNKKIAWALYALGFLGLSILLAKVFTFFNLLIAPITPSLNSVKTYFWDGKYTINLVFKGQKISILSYSPQERKVTILKIPGDALIYVPKGFGEWQVGSIFDLGLTAKPQIGAQLLKLSVEKLLGLPIDGFVKLDGKLGEIELEDLVQSLRKNPLSLSFSINRIQSDLTGTELVNLVKSITYVRDDKLLILDLGDSSITESKLLQDQTRVLGIDTIALDLFIRKKISDPLISGDDAPVAVFNTTSHPGLANMVARVITNMGGSVAMIGNTEDSLKETKVVLNDEDTKNATFVRLTQLLAPLCLKNKCTSNESKVNQSRAKINVLIGEDFYQKYFLR